MVGLNDCPESKSSWWQCACHTSFASIKCCKFSEKLVEKQEKQALAWETCRQDQAVGRIEEKQDEDVDFWSGLKQFMPFVFCLCIGSCKTA